MHHVKIWAQHFFPEANPFGVAPFHKRHAEVDDTRHAFAMHHGQVPDDDGPPIVSDKTCVVVTEVIQQAD